MFVCGEVWVASEVSEVSIAACGRRRHVVRGRSGGSSRADGVPMAEASRERATCCRTQRRDHNTRLSETSSLVGIWGRCAYLMSNSVVLSSESD